MTPSDELFKLIKCLTKSEKRFFKLFSSLQSGDKNYLKIFDYLVGQDKYDEYELKTKFSNEKLVHNLPSEKNNLYKLILKSLRAYHDGKSINSILKKNINNIEILYNKGLYREFAKKISYAKKIAEKNEKYSYQLEIVNWEKKLAYISQKKILLNIEKLIDYEKYLMNQLTDLFDIDRIYSKTNILYCQKGLMQDQSSLIILNDIATPVINNPEKFKLSNSIRVQSIFFYVSGLVELINQDFKKSSLLFNKTIDVLNNNVSIKLDSIDLYIKTFFQLFWSYIYNREFERAKRIIINIKSLKNKKELKFLNLSPSIFYYSYSQEIFLFNLYGRFEESVNLIIENEKKESLNYSSVDNEVKLLINYNKSYSYFGIGDFKKSLVYLNNILNNKQKVRQDIHVLTRLLNIIIHYELENFDFLQYLIKYYINYFNKIEEPYEIVNISMKYFRKLSRIYNHFDKIEELENFRTEIIKLPENNIFLLNFLNIEAWINSKITNLNFKKIIKESMAK
ncbi:MAG: hypothetical protein CL844_01685 [Crocinitomicaceae bacterium]|nr:hypothetical protein [Crocinitomicaceae bacterium]|tara:strand:- start:53676 stop:55199 length:1524 start_codon:yes stop_codon:yes gene_type:complete